MYNIKTKHRITSVFLLLLLIFYGVFQSYCDKITFDDISAMEIQLENIRLKIDEDEKALASIKNQHSYTESTIKYSYSLLDSYTEYCLTIHSIVLEYDQKINEIKDNIFEKQKEFDKIYDLYLSHLRQKREGNNKTILEIIVNSRDVSEFLISLERTNEIIRYDRELINSINKQKLELEHEITSLQNLKNEKQKQIETWETMKNNILSRIDTLYDSLQKLGENITDKENEILLLESIEKETDIAIKEMIETYLAQNPNMPSYAIGETMIWPLDKKWRSISSNYGYRTHPITGEKESFHGAIDIPASKSENIYAAHSGIVITATYNWSYGNYVIIDHGEIANSTDHLYTLYAHASELLVENGDTVKQGDVIAKVGETGSAKGNHLHFEVRSGNSKVEPLKFVKQP